MTKGTGLILGPAWLERGTTPVSGRFPLAVERHVLQQVSRLLPGVTTVTPHARYYSLHSYVAGEVEARKMKAEDARIFLRRCEVVMGAISVLHSRKSPASHEGLPAAHGVDKISARLNGVSLPVHALAADKGYAESPWGFHGPYSASETLMGLLEAADGPAADRWSAGGLLAGPQADRHALGRAFGDLGDLARRSSVTLEQLGTHEHLCLCQIGMASDGTMLRDVLLDSEAPEQSRAGRRYATTRMLLRLISAEPPQRANRDLPQLVAFGDLQALDPTVASMPITSAWRGVVLRWYSVNAWRLLWAGLVNELQGFTPRSTMAQPLVDLLPNCTVADFIESLPEVIDRAGNPAAAEESDDVWDLEYGPYELAMLLLGAQRVGRLDERVAPYFEAPEESGQDMTPSWMRDRSDEWAARSVKDFASMIVDRMVVRSQRVALSKSTLDRKKGTITIPTRVSLRDDFIFRSSNEGGGPIGLRWDQLTTILGPLGLLERTDDRWHITDLGRVYAT